MSANKIANTQARAVRTISILLLTILAMSGLSFVLGATSFKLGLDLQGGTSVTLQPRIEDGQSGKVTAEAIDQAVEIIRQRVNSLGVAESEVSAQGTGVNRQIVIQVPGETGRRIVDLVGQTAELRFRPVLAEGAANAALLVQDHGPAVLPAVRLGELWERPLSLQLIDVHHVDHPLGANVGTGAAEDAAHWVEPDVVVAHQAARALGDRLLCAVAELDRCGEVHRGVGRWESLRKRKDGDVLTRNAVVELRHVVAP